MPLDFDFNSSTRHRQTEVLSRPGGFDTIFTTDGANQQQSNNLYDGLFSYPIQDKTEYVEQSPLPLFINTDSTGKDTFVEANSPSPRKKELVATIK